MIADLKPYPSMGDSGVLGLGAIPRHWKVRRLRSLVRTPIRNGVGESAQGFRSDWPRYVRITDIAGPRTLRPSTRASLPPELAAGAPLERGDLLIAAVGATFGKTYLHTDDSTPACFAGYLVRVAPNCEVQPEFLSYWSESSGYWSQVRSHVIQATIQNLSAGRVKGLRVQLPPLVEQAAIVRYLDQVDRRVRRLVRAKRKLISLLTEQRQAIIHRAVTRGLDPDVPLKDSGVALLGQVPAHWRVVRVRDLLRRIDQGISPQAEAMLAEDGWWGVLKSGCVNGGVFRQTEHKRLPDGFAVDESLALAVGDVLVSRACGSPRYVGSVGRVRKLDYRLILSDKTFRLVFRDEALVEFFVHTAQSTYFRMHVELALRGAEGLANNLPLTSLKALPLLVPPRDEAGAITKAIDTKLARLWAAEERAQTEIALLNEYRTRLIADVVTGKLDVRATAASLADESGEPATLDEAEEDSAADDPAVDLDLVPEEAEA